MVNLKTRVSESSAPGNKLPRITKRATSFLLRPRDVGSFSNVLPLEERAFAGKLAKHYYYNAKLPGHTETLKEMVASCDDPQTIPKFNPKILLAKAYKDFFSLVGLIKEAKKATEDLQALEKEIPSKKPYGQTFNPFEVLVPNTFAKENPLTAQQIKRLKSVRGPLSGLSHSWFYLTEMSRFHLLEKIIFGDAVLEPLSRKLYEKHKSWLAGGVRNATHVFVGNSKFDPDRDTLGYFPMFLKNYDPYLRSFKSLLAQMLGSPKSFLVKEIRSAVRRSLISGEGQNSNIRTVAFYLTKLKKILLEIDLNFESFSKPEKIELLKYFIDVVCISRGNNPKKFSLSKLENIYDFIKEKTGELVELDALEGFHNDSVNILATKGDFLYGEYLSNFPLESREIIQNKVRLFDKFFTFDPSWASMEPEDYLKLVTEINNCILKVKFKDYPNNFCENIISENPELFEECKKIHSAEFLNIKPEEVADVLFEWLCESRPAFLKEYTRDKIDKSELINWVATKKELKEKHRALFVLNRSSNQTFERLAIEYLLEKDPKTIKEFVLETSLELPFFMKSLIPANSRIFKQFLTEKPNASLNTIKFLNWLYESGKTELLREHVISKTASLKGFLIEAFETNSLDKLANDLPWLHEINKGSSYEISSQLDTIRNKIRAIESLKEIDEVAEKYDLKAVLIGPSYLSLLPYTKYTFDQNEMNTVEDLVEKLKEFFEKGFFERGDLLLRLGRSKKEYIRILQSINNLAYEAGFTESLRPNMIKVPDTKALVNKLNAFFQENKLCYTANLQKYASNGFRSVQIHFKFDTLVRKLPTLAEIKASAFNTNKLRISPEQPEQSRVAYMNSIKGLIKQALAATRLTEPEPTEIEEVSADASLGNGFVDSDQLISPAIEQWEAQNNNVKETQT